MACGGGFVDGATSEMDDAFSTVEDDGTGVDPEGSDAMESVDPGDDVELGQTQQAWGWWSFRSSCSDPDGTDSVLAAIGVSTAQELRRWQPTVDFKVSSSMLVLTDAGKARCADGTCFNTQALLDLQKDSAGRVEVRPGVKLSPRELRERLTDNWSKQKSCSNRLFFGCKAPEHEFKFLTSAPGACDMYYWFEVRTPLGALLSRAGLDDLKEKLIWLDEEDNSYIQFQTDGNNVAIDPTYGLNQTSATQVGLCSAACTKVSNTNVVGQCCSCNGTKRYARAAWNANTYLCQ